jgi:hypothetical protein
MAEKQSPSSGVKPPNPPGAKLPNPPGTKHPNPPGTKQSSYEVGTDNIVPVTIDKLSPEQKLEFVQIMKSAQEKFMNSFKETRQGTVIQKYKLKVVAADEPRTSSSQDGRTKGAKGGVDGSGDKGADPRDGEVEDIGEEDAEEQEPPRCNNFQDQVDYAVQHALTNQSGVLVNTLTNMIKSVVDGTITEHQNTGPVFLPNGVFPQYKNLVTGNQQHTANAPPVQLTAAVSALATGAPSSAQRQVVNPHVLTREQPQHVGHNINRLTQEQIAAMFAPTQPTVEPVQSTPIRQQVIQPIRQQTVQQIPTG